jgi:hypothetical protein
MTNKIGSRSPQTLLPNEVGEEVQRETETEEESDDDDCTPYFIRPLLENPPLLPHESRDHFMQIFRSFEFGDTCTAKTATEYLLVYSITVLTWEVIRYHRMKIALMLNQTRPAVEALFRKTHEGAAMEGAATGLRIAGNLSANEWFADPVSQRKHARRFEAAGFAPNAVEGEAFMRSLTSLATIETLIVSAQKRLSTFIRDLERRYGNRGAEMRLTAMEAIARASQSENE